jgi:hypothetical protein
MFLFNKRTRNIIKYVWAVFATLIILSMVVAYSGFATLARPQPEQIEIPEEIRQQLQLQREGITPGEGTMSAEEQEALRAIEEGRIDISSESTEENGDTSGETQTPPSQEFKLEI